MIYIVELELSLPPRLKFSLYLNFLLYIQYDICPPKSDVLTLLPLSMMKVLVQDGEVGLIVHADSAQVSTPVGCLHAQVRDIRARARYSLCEQLCCLTLASVSCCLGLSSSHTVLSISYTFVLNSFKS